MYLDVRVFLWKSVYENDIWLKDSVLLIVFVYKRFYSLEILIVLHDF